MAFDDPNDPLATPLPQDDSPVSEPDDIPPAQAGQIDDTHPATDTNVQAEEEYDEGLSGAAEAAELNTDSAVKDYNPEQDDDQAL
jgi:hypothetical protein